MTTSILEAVKVLVAWSYNPVATKCRAGLAATIEFGNWVAKLAKLLNTMTLVVFALAVKLPIANSGRNTAGRPAGGAGAACGTILGLADREVRAMLSGPTRITPAL